MKYSILIVSITLVSLATLPTQNSTGDELLTPIVAESLVFAENNGMLAVEAEHFFKQTRTERRAFYRTTREQKPEFDRDGDPPHVGGASGGAYLEILPDTRRNHSDKLIANENFSNQPGKLAVLHYKVNVRNPGRYYVWVRAYSTGSEDNGLHVGIDGNWPASGQRLQWCEGKQSWRWESKQRTEQEHCGVPHQIFLDIDTAGEHIIQFSMREDGFEFDKWLMTTDRDFIRPLDAGPNSLVLAGELPEPFPAQEAPPLAAEPIQERDPSTSPTTPVSQTPLFGSRQPDGRGTFAIEGELRTWHKITWTLDGPYAHEYDNDPNPFTDYRIEADFRHPDGTRYLVPGYFAADGNAAETSAAGGTKWRVHFAPDRPGQWSYTISLTRGKLAAVQPNPAAELVHQFAGTIFVEPTNKTGRDFRSDGRLQYVGKRYLQHGGSKKYFLKAGADAPETLLGYADFDDTIAGKKKVPLKKYAQHASDWKPGDPSWQDGKGKGLIGAVNYLSSKGCNAFSFLTYNAGGDGDNVWPFVQRDDKLHYDCSKLDQWAMVFDHATRQGMYLHFKMQETEIDDHRGGNGKARPADYVPESLDGGNLGVQRKLYCRELIARFGHNLALNWNLGEENTQSTEQQIAMIDYLHQTDPYDHNIVIHTFPPQQDQVYRPLLGQRSNLTGVSLQNSHIKDTHWQTVKWVRASEQAGKPWIVSFDESGSAAHGQCPDLGYQGFDGTDQTGKRIYTQHEVRRQTLWGTLMGGGAGVEYYFGYQFPENDLLCEDWRSRDQSWDYCRIAIEFFQSQNVPFVDMQPMDELVGNPEHDNRRYCFAQPDEIYLVYLPDGGQTELDLTDAAGLFSIKLFDPRNGGEPIDLKKTIRAGRPVTIDSTKADGEDWLLVVRKLK